MVNSPETESTSTAQSQAWPSQRDAYYSLFVMTIVVMFTVIDRQVLNLMIEPMKADFKISDTRVALLIGAAFSITYGLAGIPLARIADIANRRNLIAASLAFWSLCTLGCSVAQNYAGMFLARLGIGIGESGYGPASWSIATDNFPREKVAFATGTYGLGAMAGVGLASFLGGAVIGLVADLPELPLPFGGVIRPWQWAFVIVSLPGLLWTLMVLTTKEPPRRGVAAGEKPPSVPVGEIVRWLINDWRTYVAVIGGSAMKVLVATGQLTWGVALFQREFGWALSKAGMVMGAMTLLVSPIAMILGGKLSERWARGGRSDANLRIVIYALLGSVPVLAIAPLLPSPYLVLAATAIGTFVSTLGYGPGLASFQVITPNRMRAQVSSLTLFGTNVIAFALSPLIVALFTDYVFKDESALKYSIALSTAIMGVLALVVTAQGLKPYARSYERAVRENF
jgi:MFS family permease